MKKNLLVALFFLLGFVVKGQSESPEIVKVGDVMPAFTIVSDDGTTFSSAELKGKVVLINFFATWCPPCQKELAEVEAALWPQLKEKKDFVLLVIGRDHSDEELAKYNEKKGFTFPLYPDKGRVIFDLFAKSQIPRSYLIGKNGKVIDAHVGYNEADFHRLMQKIEQLLK